MEYLIVCLTAFLTSGLTFFSGFGLGTLLLPAFALFFQIPVAVALTAVVHFLNNVFKLTLIGRHADRSVVVRFGVPALVAAILGAEALVWLADLDPLAHYRVGSRSFQIVPAKVIVAMLMIVFALPEMFPTKMGWSLTPRLLPLGGVLSGFFGGLSGHQGPLRSAFLLKCIPDKERFIGTGVVIACLVDVARLMIYGSQVNLVTSGPHLWLLAAATLSAFAGAVLGNRFLRHVEMHRIRVLVGVLLVGIAMGLGSGVL